MCWLYAITKYGYVMSLDDVFRAIDDARRLGFRLFEIEGVGTQLQMVAKNKAKIKNRCNEAGLKIVNFVPVLPDLTNIDGGKRKVALADFRLGCEIASFLGADMVELDSYYPPLYVTEPYDITKEFAEGKWTSEGPIEVGSTAHYIGTHRSNKGEEWNAVVTEFVKNKSLTMLCKGANKHTHDQTNYYTFEPTTKGTKFTMSMEYEMPSIGGKLLMALGGKRMVEGWLAKIAENVKKAVEAS
jgi:hypothetical protein